MIKTLLHFVHRIVSFLTRSNANPDGCSFVLPRSVEAETLEARMLFSAAPVEAPDEGGDGGSDQAAEESVVTTEQSSAATAESTEEGSASEQTGSSQNENQLPAVGDSEIAADQEVTLIDINEQAAALNQQTAESAAAEPVQFTAAATNQNLTLGLDTEGNVQISDDTGAVLLSQSLNSITELTITGNDLDNTLVVDFINGNPIPTGGLTFDGVNRGTDFDVLELANVNVDTLVGDAVNLHDGSLELVFANGARSTIDYLNIEPIAGSSITAANVTLNFSGVSETITVSDGGGGTTTVSSTSGESVNFANPTGSLTINAGGGNDTVNITGLGSGFAADLIVNGQAGSDAVNVFGAINTGDLTIDANRVAINATVNASGDDITLIADNSGNFGNGVRISADVMTSGTGSIAITGVSGTGTFDRGVYIFGGGTAVTTQSGSIQITGTSANDRGVYVVSADVLALGSGDVTISGTSTGIGSGDSGVELRSSLTLVRSSSGDVSITGQSVADDGVAVIFSDVSAGASGNVTITGTGGNGGGDVGILMATTSSLVSVQNGILQLNGTSTGDDGIFLDGGADLRAFGTGSVVLNGTGGTGGGDHGVYIEDAGSTVITSSGDLLVTGTSTGDAGIRINAGLVLTIGGGDVIVNGTSTVNSGLRIDTSGDVRANASGDIIINGTGGGSFGNGIFVAGSGSTISTINGDIDLTGTSADDEGVLISGTVSSTGAGNISIVGTGGLAPGVNDGVAVFSTGTITSNTGDIEITGHAGDEGVILFSPVSSTGGGNITITGTSAAPPNNGFVNTAGGSVTSLGGDITINADLITIGAAIEAEDISIEASGDVTVTATGSVTQAGGSPASTGVQILESEDFESGLLDGQWTTASSTVNGRIDVTGIRGTAEGSFALVMDRNPSGAFNRNEAIWTVDLSGVASPTLTFSHMERGDETHNLPSTFTGSFNGDGVAISADGVTWHTILNPPNQSSGIWEEYSFDLAAEAAAAGISLGSNFQIKFQQYDNFPFNSDGRGYDAISISAPVTVAGDGIAISSLTGSVSIDGSISAERDITIEAADDIALASTATVTNTGAGGGGGGGGLPTQLIGSTANGLVSNVYEIDPVTGASVFIGTPTVTGLTGLAYDTNTATVYGVDAFIDSLVTVNTTTGQTTTVGPLGVNIAASGLAFDPNSNTLYHVTGGVLRSINPATGAATFVGSGPASANLTGAAFDPGTNTLYAVGNDVLYTINTATGAQTVVGNLGVFGGSSLTGLAFDSSTDTLYLGNLINDALYTVDTVTGAATLVGSHANDIQGLAAIPGSGPAAPTPSITLTADADGDANGSGGAITMADGAQIDAGDAEVSLNADEDITVSNVSSAGLISVTSGSGAILDGGDSDADFEDGFLVAVSATGVGSSGNSLDTAVSNLEAVGGTGGVFVDNTGDLIIGQISDVIGVSAANANIEITAASSLIITETIEAAGGDITLFADNSTGIGSGVSIQADALTSGSGDITITGTGGTSPVADGVEITIAGNEIRTQNGDITITGDSTSDEGVYISGAQVNATGSGNVTIIGTAGNGLGDFGLFFAGSTGQVSSVDGTVTLSGTSGGDEGIVLAGFFKVLSTGNGDIDITGTGNGTLPGSTTTSAGFVMSSSSEVIGAGGDITITGTALDDAGVFVSAGSKIRNTGDGNITIIGTGGAQQNGDGISISGTTVLVSTVDGDITIVGNSPNDEGVQITGLVEATGAGNISITGTGDTTQTFDDGVFISGLATLGVRTNTGNIEITGHAGDEGVIIFAPVTSTGGGDITITGTSAGPSTFNIGFVNSGNGAISSNGGDITVNADTITIGTTIDAASGDIFLQPVDPASSIGINAPGTFNLSAVEMTNLNSTGTVFVGLPAGSGAVDINPVDLSAETYDLDVTGGSISVTGLDVGIDRVFLTATAGAVTDGGTTDPDVTAFSLVATSATGVGSGADALETAVTRFEGVGGTGGVFLDNTGDLTIGLITAVAGVSAANADIEITTAGGLWVRETIDASEGDITLSGSTIGISPTGVRINADVVTTGGGDISITGIGGTGGGDRGVWINGSFTEISTVDGDIQIVGTSAGDDGIFLGGADIKATGTGSVSLSGTSTGLSTGDMGVIIIGTPAEISAAGGSVEITGSSIGDDGIFIAGSATISNSGGGDVTLTGTGGTGFGDYGVNLAQSASVNAVDGAIEITGTSTGDEGVYINFGGKVLSTGSGDITIEGTGGNTPGDIGVFIINTGSEVSSNNGDITITGSSSGDEGTVVSGGADVLATGSGNITITGTSTGTPASPISAFGLVVASTGTTVSAAGGDIELNGTGIQDMGVLITSSAHVTNTGSGDITITGTGGTGNVAGTSGDGVQIALGTTIVTTEDGDITITGTSQSDEGVQTSGLIESTGSGNITITGTAGPNADDDGVVVLTTGKVLTNTGSITLDGSGGGDGVVFVLGNPQVASSDGGDITIIGTGGTDANSDGVTMTDASVSTTGAGIIEITGDGSAGDDGIVQLNTTISTTGGGDITLTGTGGSGVSAFGYGANNPTNVVSTAGGTITFDMIGDTDLGGSIDAGSGSVSVTAQSGFIFANATISGAAAVDFLADDEITLTGTASLNGGDVTADGASIDMEAGSLIDATGTVDLDAAGDIIISEIVAVGAVTITSAGGTIQDRGAATDVSGSTITFDGDVNPGVLPGIGTLAVSGGTAFTSGSGLTIDLEGTAPGTQHDQMVVTGTVTLNNADLDVELGGGYSPALGDEIVLIDNDGADAVSGTFLGLTEGSVVTASIGGVPGALFTISYVGGDGNDVVLTGLGLTATTGVSLDGSGNLVVDDIDGGDSDDDLTIRIVGSDFVISDPNLTLGTLIAGATQTGPGTIIVPVALVSGGLDVNTLAGDDRVTIEELSGFGGFISVDAGADQDRIILDGTTVAMTGGNGLDLTAEEVDLIDSSISTAGGGISIVGSGTAGGNHQGVHLSDSALSTGGSGTVTITGEGGDTGSSNQGVLLSDGSSIASTDGDIVITGSSNGSVSYNRGVEIADSTIASSGTGSITLAGTGSQSASKDNNSGVFLDHSGVSASSGNISITGDGGSGRKANEGVRIETSDVTTSGELDILGVASSSTSKQFNHGVYIYKNSTVNGGVGSSIIGTGGGGNSSNHGVMMHVGITSNIPLIDILGTAGSGNGNSSKDLFGNFFTP